MFGAMFPLLYKRAQLQKMRKEKDEGNLYHNFGDLEGRWPPIDSFLLLLVGKV